MENSTEIDFYRLTITVLGEHMNISPSNDAIVESFGAVRYRDAYQIKCPSGECWLFNYGILICWNTSEDDRRSLCQQLTPYIIKPTQFAAHEQYTWSIQQGNPLTIHNDKLTLPHDEPLLRLALSHAFAQSAQIASFEDYALSVIERNASLAKELAKTGKVPLTRKQLACHRGELIETINDINLHFGLLDTPEFFWDYPELEEPYMKLAKYLDIQPRIGILDKKLSTIQNMLDMLASEQNHKHSAFLEWIIIVLIAVDIIIYFF